MGLFVIVAIYIITIMIIVYLLRKCDGGIYEFNDVEDEYDKTNVLKRLFNLTLHPKKMIMQKQTLTYDQEEFTLWLYAIGAIYAFLLGGWEGNSFNIGIGFIKAIFSPVSVMIGKWFFAAIQGIAFRYIAGIKMSKEERVKLFEFIFSWDLIIGGALSLICLIGTSYFSIDFLQQHIYITVLLLSSSSIILWIWKNIIYYLHLVYRYDLSPKVAVKKLILINLVYGLVVLLIGGITAALVMI